MILHNIPPIYDSNSKILILGSFPSVKSREGEFFYDHPQNRFWKVLAAVYQSEIPITHSQKREFLIKNNIALWDVIGSCEIIGSADTTIKNVIPNDLSDILNSADIKAIFCNGNTSFNFFNKFSQSSTKIIAKKLPSTSPANAAFSLERLIEEWSVLKEL